MSTATTQEPVKVGDVLYREVSHQDGSYKVEDVTVGRVGRKYFYLIGYQGQIDDYYPYNIESLRYTDKKYGDRQRLYRTTQEIHARRELTALRDRLWKWFQTNGKYTTNTLEELREAARILGVELTEVERATNQQKSRSRTHMPLEAEKAT